MKIEEAKKGIMSLPILNGDRFVFSEPAMETALNIIDQIEPDQPKPVVPKFVAEWIEEAKEGECSLCTAFGLVDGNDRAFNWLFGGHESNQDTFARAWLDGYEVEKEPLYTVEIPNPNTVAITILARSIVGDVLIYNEFDNCWKKNSRYQLTEQEIRKDFDWAFRWAEEVK